MSITTVVGFDPASIRNIGWCLVKVHEDETGAMQAFEPAAGTFILSHVEEPWKALWPMFVVTDTFLTNEKPDLVVVEKTSSFSGGFVTGQVSNCLGVILACCGKHNIPVAFVYPSHVKKVIVGKGKATKNQMKKAVETILSDLSGTTYKYDSEHAYDALANVLCWMIEKGFIEQQEDEEQENGETNGEKEEPS